MKVLLIDDHPLILSALQSVIEGMGGDVTVVGVGSARAARALPTPTTVTSLPMPWITLCSADRISGWSSINRTFIARLQT